MVKTQVERIKEVIEIKKQINNIGFPKEYEPLKEFDNHTNLYVKEGIAWSGKIKFPEYGRCLHVILTTKQHLYCNAILKVL